MTDGGVAFQPGQEQATVPFRPRSAYVGYRAFGRGDGAVLVEPEVAHDLRASAEFATQQGRVAGGLLYGHTWGDDLGVYLVIDGFLEAGPGEDHGDRLQGGERDDDYALSAADLRLLRADAARMYAAAVEVGWWRTRGSAGAFGTSDFATQAELAGPGGAGLLVYGSGPRWGTAYLGPDGQAPDAVGRLVATADPAAALAPRRPVPETAAPEGLYEPERPYGPAGSDPEIIDLGAGESLAQQAPPELVRPLEPAEVIDLGAGESLLEETVPELDEPAEPVEVIDLAAGESLLTDPVADEELPDDPLPGDPMPGEPLPHHSLPEEQLDDDFFEPLGEGPLADGPLDDERPDGEFTDGEFTDEAPVDDEAAAAAATGPGTALATRRAALTPAPKPAGPRVISPVRVPRGEWGTRKEANPGYVGPHTPIEVKIVVGGLITVPVIAAVIIGILVNSAIVAVVAAVVFLLAVLGVIWMSRL